MFTKHTNDLRLGSRPLLVRVESTESQCGLTPSRDVGFLRYWKVANIPLFILAAPVSFMTIYSATWATTIASNGVTNEKLVIPRSRKPETTANSKEEDDARTMVFRLAMPQLILAILALTSYHVQTITRLSSGYPVWYWWLASLILTDEAWSIWGRKWNPSEIASRGIVIYAVLQGALFASFLPPA